MGGLELLLARVIAVLTTAAALFLFWSAFLVPPLQGAVFALTAVGALLIGGGSLVAAYLNAILHRLPTSSGHHTSESVIMPDAEPVRLSPGLGFGLALLIIAVAVFAALG